MCVCVCVCVEQEVSATELQAASSYLLVPSSGMVIGPVGAIGEVPLATAYLVTANPKSDDETTSPESRYGAYTHTHAHT